MGRIHCRGGAARYGRLDGAFNNAGIGGGDWEATTADDYDSLMQINSRGVRPPPFWAAGVSDMSGAAAIQPCLELQMDSH